jgi:hypothetical protein
MPIALDMTINEVAYVSGDNGVALSGDSIVPVAMGGPFRHTSSPTCKAWLKTMN